MQRCSQTNVVDEVDEVADEEEEEVADFGGGDLVTWLLAWTALCLSHPRLTSEKQENRKFSRQNGVMESNFLSSTLGHDGFSMED